MDTCQLLIFVRVTSQFIIVGDQLDLCLMKGTTTGRDILDEERNLMTTLMLNDQNLCDLTTDGAPAIIGNQDGFMSLMYKTL